MDLKTWIKKNNIEIDVLAVKFGVSMATLYRMMRGKSPRLELACQIYKETKGQVTYESMVEKKSKKKLLNKD